MFRKMLVASAAAAMAAPGAFAQQASASSVRMYGIVDIGIESARASGSATTTKLTSLASGSNAASRLGFDAREDLGGGMYAGARLEYGFDADTGTPTSAIKFFNRGSFVNLGGSWGELRLGREYTPSFYVLQQGDINGLNLYGNAGTFTQLGRNGFTRSDNSINYISPTFADLTVRLGYSIGDESPVPPRDSGRTVGLSVAFKRESLMLAGFYQARSDVFPASTLHAEKTTFAGIVGRWDEPGYSIGGGAARWNPAGPESAAAGTLSSWWIGGAVKFGLGEIRAQYGKLRAGTTSAIEPEGSLYSVSYLYSLSKRTTLYASYGSLDNNATGAFRLEASSRVVALPIAAGLDTKALTLGITHRF